MIVTMKFYLDIEVEDAACKDEAVAKALKELNEMSVEELGSRVAYDCVTEIWKSRGERYGRG
jgi:hypothetical protein